MKTIWKYRFWILGFCAMAGLLLVSTGYHKRLLRSVHFRLLNAGIVTPRNIDLVEFEPRPFTADSLAKLQLLDESGQVLSLTDWQGNRVFINKWATWCAPCIAEMPGIHRLYQDAGSSTQFIMITFDTEFEKAKEFKARKGFTFPIYQIYGYEPEYLKTHSLPATFLIPPGAGTLYRFEGMREYDTPEFKGYLEQLAD